MNHTLQAALLLLLLLPLQLFSQTPTSADCLGALPICQQVIVEPNPGVNSGNYSNEINTTNSCVSGEDNSIWYTFTANADGFLNFVITPNDPTDDYDWALFDITDATCGDIFSNPNLEVSCNAAGGDPCHGPTGATGATPYDSQGGGCGTDPPTSNAGLSPFNEEIPMTAGNTYVLMVSNWTGSPNGYTIDFSNSTDIGILDQVNPELQTATFPEDCDDNTINITFSENIQCSTIADFNFVLTGTGGPYIVTLSSDVCDQGGDHDRFFELTVNPPLPASGNFTLSLLVDEVTEVLDLCDNPSIPWSDNFSVNNELDNAPTLNPDQTTICAGENVSIAPLGNNGAVSPNFNFYSDAGLNNILFTGSNYAFVGMTTMQIWVTEVSGICESPPTIFSLTVNPVPSPPIILDPDPVCAGSLILDLNVIASGGLINWYDSNPSNGNPFPIGQGIPFSPIVNTDTPGDIDFWLTETNAFGCVSDPSMLTVEITPLPAAPLTNPLVEICEGDIVPTLEAIAQQAGGTILWYDQNPMFNLNLTPIATGPFFTPDLNSITMMSTTFWMLQVDGNGCVGLPNQTILVINPLPILISEDLTCAADLNTYTATLSFSNANSITANNGGIVQNNGNGNFTISVIDINIDLIITVANQNTGCAAEFSFSAPNCGCPSIDPPVSAGDVQICMGDDFPELSVNVGIGETVDWYDAAVGGNLLLASSPTFTPTAVGTYFAETHLIGSNCTSASRTAVTVSVNPLPILTDTLAVCAENLAFYALSLTFTNGDSLVISEGDLVNNGGGSFDVSNIDIANTFTATSINTTTLCSQDISITPPACECPDVDAPISGGDIIVCEGDSIPDFTASVGVGETVDWYDAATGGTLLLSDTTSFTPTTADTFYAETRVIINNCLSAERTAFILSINPLPILTDSLKNCAADLLNYAVELSFENADSLIISEGILVNLGAGNFTISAIDVNNNLVVTAIDTHTLCSTDFIIEAPDCVCDLVDPPISDGDLEMCPGGDFPTLSVSVSIGETVDWYDAATGGILLLQGSNTYTPTAIGTYFAETRVINNGCVSETRTAVTLSEFNLPTLISAVPDCSADLAFYSLVLTFTDTDSLAISEGVLINNGGGLFTINGVDINNSLTVTAINNTTSCLDSFTIDPPDCACLDVNPPVSGGDLAICAGEMLPTLSVSVGIGETVDWYDALVGGNLILASSTTFTPTVAGIYFAETRDIANNCTSSVRTAVSLTINVLPILTDTLAICSPDLLTYTLELTFSAADDLVITEGVLLNNGDGSFTVTGIDVNNTFLGTAVNTLTNCMQSFSIFPPNCPCPIINMPTNDGDLAICDGEVIPTLSVSIGADETVDWYDTAIDGTLLLQNSITFTPIVAGTYFAATRSLVNNCVSERIAVTLTIYENPSLMINDSTDPLCGLNDGSIEVNAITGQAPFMYQIDSDAFQSEAIFIDLAGETVYTFTVEDDNTCVGTIMGSLTSPIGPTAVISSIDILTCNTTSFQINAGGTTADGGLVFEWLFDDEIISADIQIDVNNPGIYILNAIQAGCTSSDTVIIEENLSTDIVVNIQNETALDCNIDMVTLDGTGSSSGDMITYQWFFDGDIIVGATTNIYEATTNGLYTLQVTDNETGCAFANNFILINNENYPVANAGNDGILNCIIENVNLNGSNSQSGATIVYQWFNENGLPITGATTNTWIANATGIYTLQVTDTANGCFNEDAISITGDFTPPNVDAGADDSLDCNEEMLDLDATTSAIGANFSYEWSAEFTGNILSGQATLTPTIGGAGFYYLTVTNTTNGCTAADSTFVDKIDEIQTAITVVAEDESCFGDKNGSIALLAEDPNAQILYSVNGAPFSAAAQFTNLNADTYIITAEDSHGCQWDSTVIIQAGVDLLVDSGDDIFIHLGDSTQLEGMVNILSSEIDTLIWSNSDLLLCKTCLEPSTFYIPETTTFLLSVWDKNNCFDSDEVTVFVDKQRQVFIPNAFSPNDDGINDILTIYTGNDVVSIKSFLIFDRWGESIYEVYNFEGNAAIFGWNGKYRNQKLNPGVYVYVAEVEFLDGEKVVYSGEVILVK